jgi:hypothetical protein
MSHVEMDPHVCQCSCHKPGNRSMHNVPCCLGRCYVCKKNYKDERHMAVCELRIAELLKSELAICDLKRDELAKEYERITEKHGGDEGVLRCKLCSGEHLSSKCSWGGPAIDASLHLNIPEKRLRDFLYTGLGNSISSFIVAGFEPTSLEEHPELMYAQDAPFLNTKGTILLQDKYDESWPRKIYKLDLKSMISGLALLAEKNPHQFSRFMDDTDDAITGDVWIQYAIHGEELYG